MEKNNLISYTLNEFLTSQYIFHIPTYQRGYRWEKEHVEKLHEDVWYFYQNSAKQELGEYYCLQPIIVKKRDEVGREWEIVDGQQRLTTLFIILKQFPSFIQEDMQYFEICFDRDGAGTERKQFLQDIANGNGDEELSKIDFHYFKKAAEAADVWIKKTKNECLLTPEYANKSSTFYSNLRDALVNVLVIWYEVNAEVNVREIFEHINAGKIPLTDSELIKASFLNSRNFGGNGKDIGQNRVVQLAQGKLARMWDEIEWTLCNEEFWGFIHPHQFNKASRIEYLFDILYARWEQQNSHLSKRESAHATFHYFEERMKLALLSPELTIQGNWAIESIWDEVKQVFRTLQDWYADSDLFNSIGYLLHIKNKDNSVAEVEQLLNKCEGCTKGEFRSYLNNELRKMFQSVSLERLDYENDRRRIESLLLLCNVETVRRSGGRFPFHSISGTWSVEHIHARHSETLKGEALADWLRWHSEFIQRKQQDKSTYSAEIDSIVEQITLTSKIEEDRFQKLIVFLESDSQSPSRSHIHPLQNLTLISCSQNSALSNSVFSVKRTKILDMHKRGEFVPPCTLHVFLKYYTNDARQLDYWSRGDGEAYFKEIESLMAIYIGGGTCA